MLEEAYAAWSARFMALVHQCRYEAAIRRELKGDDEC